MFEYLKHTLFIFEFFKLSSQIYLRGPTMYTTNYWIAANSWGQSWNGDGTFRIRRGSNEAGIETCFDYGYFREWRWLRTMFGGQ